MAVLNSLLPGWRKILGAEDSAGPQPTPTAAGAIPVQSPRSRDPVRDLQGELEGAGDEKLLQVVALVDRLPQRGLLDTVVDSVRLRLAWLRPPRPLSYPRVLFSPADSLIIAAPDWQSGGIGIPRSILAPLGEYVRSAIAPELLALKEMQSHGITHADTEQQIAVSVWRKASGFFRNAPAPPGWTTETGIPMADYAPLAADLATILRAAPTIAALARSGAPALSPEIKDIATIIKMSEWKPTTAAALMVCVMSSLPAATGPLMSVCASTVGELAAKRRRMFESAMDFIVDQVDWARESLDIGQAVEDANRMAAIMSGFDKQLAFTDVVRKRRAAFVANKTALRVRKLFGTELDNTILREAQQVAADPSDANWRRLAISVDELQRLGQAGALLGVGDHCRRPVKIVMQRVQSLAMSDLDRDRLLDLIDSLTIPTAPPLSASA